MWNVHGNHYEQDPHCTLWMQKMNLFQPCNYFLFEMLFLFFLPWVPTFGSIYPFRKLLELPSTCGNPPLKFAFNNSLSISHYSQLWLANIPPAYINAQVKDFKRNTFTLLLTDLTPGIFISFVRFSDDWQSFCNLRAGRCRQGWDCIRCWSKIKGVKMLMHYSLWTKLRKTVVELVQ